MKFLLIGHSILDHVEKYEEKSLKPGGIFYSVLGLLSCVQKEDSIFLLTSLNNSSQHLFSSTYQHINLRLSSSSASMPEVILKVSDVGEREEIYKNISEPLSLDSLEDFDSPDGILINMITGFDLTPIQLKWLRNKFNCPIYFDVHTLSRGLDTNMNRFFRPIPNIQDWLDSIDILQCNENELDSICETETIEQAIEFIMAFGVKIVVITKAERGSEVYVRNENSFIHLNGKPEKVETKNKIGCGDIFGAVFFYSYISTQDVFSSLILANKAGAAAASTENLTTHSKLVL